MLVFTLTNDNYVIYSDGDIYYVYQVGDLDVIGGELDLYFFSSPSLDECMYYTQ